MLQYGGPILRLIKKYINIVNFTGLCLVQFALLSKQTLIINYTILKVCQF